MEGMTPHEVGILIHNATANRLSALEDELFLARQRILDLEDKLRDLEGDVRDLERSA